MGRTAPLSLPSQCVSAVGKLVSATMGLHFPAERAADLERALTGAARDAGCSTVVYANALLREARIGGAEARRLLEALAGHITVGETYFFREPSALAVFEGEILPELIRARSADRRIRIWSAGCCTGEEPYTIAMILDRLLGDADDWNISILATDITPRFLHKAVDGVYGEWSFRGMPPEARARWFRKRADGRWQLRESIRRKVTFSCLNLAADSYPSLLSGTNAMDVVFCRNVFIYLAPAQSKEVARKLHDSLVDGGWLIVGVAEASPEIFAPFCAVPTTGGTLYRKGEHRGDRACQVSGSLRGRTSGALRRPKPRPSSASVKSREAEQPALPAVPAGVHPPTGPKPVAASPGTRTPAGLLRPSPGRRKQRAAAAQPADRAARSHELLASARRSASEGKLRDAAEWCGRAVEADKMNPATYYLLSAIQSELGEQDAAGRSLSRALYVDDGFVLAHFGLANLDLARGRRTSAKRHLTNALVALRGHANEEILPESDGLTMGRLKEIVTTLLAAIASNHPRAIDEGAGE